MDLSERVRELEAERERLRDRCATLEATIAAHDLLPVPPTRLRVRVGGWDDPDHFLGVGRKIYWDIKRLLRSVDHSLADFSSMLDFGCGCGRLSRHLVPGAQQSIVGCDLDPESIDWCRENLVRRGLTFVQNGERPPLPFADRSFDLVIAISVFSHLPEALQAEWLAELARVLRPNGCLIASVHGESLLPADTPSDTREQFMRQGFLYSRGFGTPGLPDFYQTAYHRADYIAANWQRDFRVALELPRGINNHQDAYVLVRT